MNALAFIQKWRRADLTERSASQQHFLDLCEVVEHPKPAAADATGATFTFEKLTAKHRGGYGFADVWKKGFFAWEYKGKHKDLDAAYDQLLKYREALENPPLLIVSDMDRIVVRTNFTATPTEIHEVRLDNLASPDKLAVLHGVFHKPELLRPDRPSAAITAEAARHIAEIAQDMRARGLDPHEVARFLDRIVFCLFAEDIALLPEGLFSRLVRNTRDAPERFSRMVGQLFDAMADGGEFGSDTIRHFNGDLFTKGPVLTLTEEEMARVYEASELKWAAVDPSIFGTLFERGLDPGKRAQIGAHYTSREDIETLVEPVVLWPLRRQWDETRQTVRNLLETGRKDGKLPKTSRVAQPPSAGEGGEAQAGAPVPHAGRPPSTKARNESERLVARFHDRLASLKVLDPACGSGNFLYVTLQRLKDLEKEVIVFAQERDLGEFPPRVAPWQLYGIEVSPYAHDLAQMVVWIGYLQWIKGNGFGTPTEPILKPMAGNFRNKDAILDLSDPEDPKEPDWPKVDYIVGNPPFLGGKLLRRNLGSEYVDRLFAVYGDRIPNFSDLCCYWFEKARAQVEAGRCERAGLLATQGIRGGANREVLKRIKQTGDIFFAESDRPWVLDGANVHVSMVGFADESPVKPVLDGEEVAEINANLSSCADITRARRLSRVRKVCFYADVKSGKFDIPYEEAGPLLHEPNPHGKPNSDVVRPWINARHLAVRPRHYWVVDFGTDMEQTDAALYETPFAMVRARVKPGRDGLRRDRYRERWWLHAEPCIQMRKGIEPLARFVATPVVSKHRVFVWATSPTLPDHAVCVFAREDDYFFGVLHSRLHEVWALRQGTRLETRPRYTPTTCFETFPFPWPPGQEPADDPRVQAVAAAARELNELRENWLNPPDWTVTEVLEFPGSADGPWARYVHDPDGRGIGTVRYARTVADPPFAAALKKRTLTNLYNERPTWLDNAHRTLDEAVCAAYAYATAEPRWRPDMTDEEILERLLALNLSRSEPADA